MLILVKLGNRRASSNAFANFPLAGAQVREPWKDLFQVFLADFLKLAACFLSGQALSAITSPDTLKDAHGNIPACPAMSVGIARYAPF